MNLPRIDTSRPLLASRVSFRIASGKFVIDSGSFEYTFEGSSAERIQAILPFLDGNHDVRDIAARVACDDSEVLAFLKPLNRDERLIIDIDRLTTATSGSDFVEALKDECEFWAGEIYSQPFWKLVQSGSASKSVILGWGVEFYHFVDSANRYMAAGVASCREDARIREVLARHYVEESEHGRIFLDGLKGCGIDASRAASAPPIASTQALINYLYETAISNCFEYAGLFVVMQPSRTQLSRMDVSGFYDGLCAMYPYAAAMFSAFRDHALIDVELEHHKTTLDEIVAMVPDMVLRNAPSIVSSARLLVEHFMQYFEGIADYYGANNTPLLRRPLRLVDAA